MVLAIVLPLRTDYRTLLLYYSRSCHCCFSYVYLLSTPSIGFIIHLLLISFIFRVTIIFYIGLLSGRGVFKCHIILIIVIFSG